MGFCTRVMPYQFWFCCKENRKRIALIGKRPIGESAMPLCRYEYHPLTAPAQVDQRRSQFVLQPMMFYIATMRIQA